MGMIDVLTSCFRVLGVVDTHDDGVLAHVVSFFDWNGMRRGKGWDGMGWERRW